MFHGVQDETLLHGDGVRLISVVLPSEFAVIGVCVILLGWGFVEFIFCRFMYSMSLLSTDVSTAQYVITVYWVSTAQYLRTK